MTITNIQRFATSLIALTVLMSPLASLAEHHSKSKEIVVLEPADLPEQAQMGGESFFLHATNVGSDYLYIEQQQGVRLTVLDVTDPARIKPVSSVLLKTEGSYDFVRPVSDRAELIRYRQNGNVAVLDLTKAKSPEVRAAPEIMTAFTVTDRLDSTGLLTVSGPADYAVAAPRDFQVIDFATPSNPQVLTTVKQVAHRLTNDETGTTFLLSNQGLTVIRQPQVEEDYREHEAQLSNN
jgi:hypothetical protein